MTGNGLHDLAEVGNRLLKPFMQVHFWFPSEYGTGAGYIGLAGLWIALYALVFKNNPCFIPCDFVHRFRKLEEVISVGLPIFTG